MIKIKEKNFKNSKKLLDSGGIKNGTYLMSILWLIEILHFLCHIYQLSNQMFKTHVIKQSV